MSPGLWIVLALLVAAVLFGGYRRLTDGRVRATAKTETALTALIGDAAGSRATLVQVSAPVCAPCAATRRVLNQLVGEDSTIGYVEFDAESHLDLVRELGVTRTPTVLVLDPHGVEQFRILGVPRAADLQEAINGIDVTASRL